MPDDRNISPEDTGFRNFSLHPETGHEAGPSEVSRPSGGLDRPVAPLFFLLAAGLALFALAPDFARHPEYAPLLFAAAALGCVPKVHDRIDRVLTRVRSASPRARYLTAAALFAFAAVFLPLTAWRAGGGLFPRFHDEFMELLQAQMLAHGRLWMPQHPLADFFDSFYILVKPVYASIYFPGTALFYVPGIWAGLPPWVTASMITAAAVAMLYLVVADLLDNVSGLLAALLALSLEKLRVYGVMFLSHPPMLLLVLLTLFACLRWRRRQTMGWAVAIGIFGGWAAITRPLDALCLVLPPGLLVLWRLRRLPRSRAAATIALIALAALPFLSLQLILDKGVTGHWFRAPLSEHDARRLPGLTFGFRAPPDDLHSASPLPQVRDFYDSSVRTMLTQHARDGFWRTWLLKRLAGAADFTSPAHLLFILLPLGLVMIYHTTQALGSILVIGAIGLTFVYAFWPPAMSHYGLVTLPAFLLMALSGAEMIRRRFPAAAASITLVLAVIALAGIPLLGPSLDWAFPAPALRDVVRRLARLEHVPAIVLFHYDTASDPQEEPVYNLDAAWPDDAPIIRAQDLGDRNVELFRYYASHGPPRYVYRYDRTSMTLTPLGWARDLATRATTRGIPG